MSVGSYSGLSRAQLSFDYLHTNSTTHEFLFGAVAELLDNARDASATKINIYSVAKKDLRGGYMLCFLDDGEGMDPTDAADIITFGKSSKRICDSNLIGMYGNGLKSGSMRIGNDLIVFTKKGPTMTCVFVSRTFHEQEDIDEIIVPMPAFDSQTKKPLAKSAKDKEKHKTEMDLIYKYSPFTTESQLMAEFAKIDGDSGTLVIAYNMKILDSGEPELDVVSDPDDILLSNPEAGEYDTDEGLMPEKRSFRAYVSLLYVDPRMRIFIQNKKVRTKRLAHCLYKPRLYKFSSSRFKTRSEGEAQKAREEARVIDAKAKEAQGKARYLENKYGNKPNKDQRAEIRKAQILAAELRKEAQLKKQMSDRKARLLREPKSLNFIFGMNIDNRNEDGMFVYNCSRLIKMYQKVGPQADGGVFCSGVVGIVDVPYLVLEPTHNKQDFADAKEYRHLQKAMGEHMVQYWKDLGIAQQGVTKFWENFGYISPNWKDSPSVDPKYLRKRAMQLQISLQCDLCLKWRILPFSANNVGKDFPDDWVCSMNPDPSHNRCSNTEQKMNIPEGVLKKEIKSKEQKERDLADDIRKKQEQLEKLQKFKVVQSAQELTKEEVSESETDSEKEEKPIPRRAARPEPTRRARVTSSGRSAASSKGNRKSNASRAPKRKIEVQESESESEYEEEIRTYSKSPVKSNATQSECKPLRAAAQSTKGSTRQSKSSKKANESEGASSRVPPISTQEDTMLVESEVNMDTEPDDGQSSQVDEGHSDVGTRVEVKVQKQWYPARVVSVNSEQGKWKVKFDKYPQDKYDKWFEQGSADVRIIMVNKAESESSMVLTHSPGSESGQDTVVETPSSSTQAAYTAASQQQFDDIANGYRTCLRYFLPPQWVMDKESVSQLSVQELAAFPLDDFFDHYEKGLRKLVSSFQLEATTRQQESEQTQSKLSHVRKLIAKLLKSINEEFDIDPEADTDQVDELLAACVKQALQQGD